jgi:poly-gamma-glutamate synthase PgsB/CapB
MNEVKPDSTRRILVTGSRGKSTIVRLLHTALHNAGQETYSRITGVIPRELCADKVRTISRSSGAHVEEMRWWLKQLPVSAQSIVLENSAITPDLQSLASRWLQPQVTIVSNTVPDHQEIWGPCSPLAAVVLTTGVPKGGLVVIPAGQQSNSYLLELLEARCCRIIFAEPAIASIKGYQAINLGLALATVKQLGLLPEPALQAMLRLQPDKYDFNVISYAGAELAMAFSANDINSTKRLFHSLKWPEEQTRLIYNHRRDRPGRFRSFIDWLSNSPWREVLIIGDRPQTRLGSARYLHIKHERVLRRLLQPGDRVFGCGNIAGLPLSLATAQDH